LQKQALIKNGTIEIPEPEIPEVVKTEAHEPEPLSI
jgi:hypothetical protein